MISTNTTGPTANLLRRCRVRDLSTGPTADAVHRRYVDTYGDPPEHPGGWYRPDDWRRVGFVLDRLRPGGVVLDVGSGAGQFANMLAESGGFEHVVTLDFVRFGKYIEYHDDLARVDGSVAALPFPDDAFDVVVCMEVLEHVPDEVFLAGLDELRRVCRGQLIMSIPFEEQEPMSKGHLRRFEWPDVARWFPSGGLIVIDRPRMPWMIVEERFDGSVPEPPDLPETETEPEPRTTPEQRRIRHLETELERLRNRRAIRYADRVGRLVRGARRRALGLLGRGG